VRSIFPAGGFGVELGQQELQGIEREGEAHRGDVAAEMEHAGDEADLVFAEADKPLMNSLAHLLLCAARGV
jgi:hypothetical protein